jgi:hypothetical protein
MGYEMPDTQFWHDAICTVKNQKPEFVFLAEAYWDLEWELQQLGFDYTYDKKLIDRIACGGLAIYKVTYMPTGLSGTLRVDLLKTTTKKGLSLCSVKKNRWLRNPIST